MNAATSLRAVLILVLGTTSVACGATTDPEQSQPTGATPSATVGTAVPTAADTGSPSPTPPTPSPSPSSVTVLAVGDIASCDYEADEDVAELVATLEGTLLTLGDTVYPNGTEEEFEECYDAAWGDFRDRTRPVIGNHEYHTDDGAPFWEYFGEAAGTPGEGWYSFDLGAWHIVALNSNCGVVECEADSPQGEWLTQDLAESDALCTLAFWHSPRYSSGPEGGTPEVYDFWSMLDEEGAEVVLSGHAHIYERLVPLDGDGYDDPDGIRQFIVGTGGRSLYPFGDIEPASDFRTNDEFGVLKMTLRADSYEWEFINIEEEVIDAGEAQCQ